MAKARWLIPIGMVALVLTASAGKTSAQLESTNGCSGSGTFEKTGVPVDAAGIGDQVVEILRSDTVDWHGSVTAPPGSYSGSVAVDLPPPFSELKIDSWRGKTQRTERSGVRSYDLGSFVPADVEFRVNGSHTDENGYCTGYVKLKIRGGAFDSPATPISLGATVVTGAGLVGTLRPLFRKVVA